MVTARAYLFAADVVLLTHLIFVLFVLFGLVLVYVGFIVGWSWIKNPFFRWFHLVAIGVVTLQAWLGVVCPLTILENYLREKAGGLTYEGTFISYWLQTILYYDAPGWVFAVCYTVFAGLVLASWYFIRPDTFAISFNKRG